jgi:hypothetical protein
MAPESPRASAVDEVVGEVMPEEFDWERLVRTYPIPALLVAAAGGFLLGRGRGSEILAALSVFAADFVARNVNEFLGEEIVAS